MSKTKRPQVDLDQVLAGIREQPIENKTVNRAAERVWSRLSVQTAAPAHSPALSQGIIEGCADFRALLPDFENHALPADTMMLVDDHVRGCLACRRALNHLRKEGVLPDSRADSHDDQPGVDASAVFFGAEPRSTSSGARSSRPTHSGALSQPGTGFFSARRMGSLALAALVLLAIGLPVYFWVQSPGTQAEAVADIRTVRGTLLNVEESGQTPSSAGDTILASDVLRTTRGSGAQVQLQDGSSIEMGERTELSIRPDENGTRIQLARGNILVRAAHQGDKRLMVRTGDCDVTVKGTIFSVNAGTKGSRVSVIEGAVLVSRGSQDRLLEAGQQYATHTSMETRPVAQEIGWSQEAGVLRAMLVAQGAASASQPSGTMAKSAGASSRLLDAMPSNTAIYLGFPNIEPAFGESWSQMLERIQSHQALRDFWDSKVVVAGVDRDLEEVFESLRTLGGSIGGEVAVSVQVGDEGRLESVLVLAEVRSEKELLEALSELGDVSYSANGPELRIVRTPREGADRKQNEILVEVSDGLVAWSTSAEALSEVFRGDLPVHENPFVHSEFHKRIAEVYAEGAGMLVAADLGLLAAGAAEGGLEHVELLEDLGLMDADYLVADLRDDKDATSYHASLTFDRERRGLAAWMDEPAPLSALEFVSPDASVVAGIVLRNPASFLGELFDILARHRQGFSEGLAEFEATHRIRLIDDIAAPIGGEMVLALDGPLLPSPSWKVILEVYDARKLQQTIAWAVDQINQAAADDNQPFRLTLTQSRYAGRTVYSLAVYLDQAGQASADLRAGQAATEIHYVFVDGYVLLAPNRVLLDRAIRYRETGYTLNRARAFRDLLPQDRYANFSALVYHNLGPLISQVLSEVSASAHRERESARELFQSADLRPTLIGVYGESDRIQVAGAGSSSFAAGSDLDPLFSVGNLLAEVMKNCESADK